MRARGNILRICFVWCKFIVLFLVGVFERVVALHVSTLHCARVVAWTHSSNMRTRKQPPPPPPPSTQGSCEGHCSACMGRTESNSPASGNQPRGHLPSLAHIAFSSCENKACARRRSVQRESHVGNASTKAPVIPSMNSQSLILHAVLF
ncbi:hypothetical protein BC835DRAFT_232532 [Cytidiella melzeri]|nr:hypothetical protein BC835DRAFT_232532 [Cytidiella melzeri]